MVSPGEILIAKKKKKKGQKVNLLLSNTASASVGKRKLHPPSVCISVLLQPAIRVKPISIREHITVEAMHRIGLAAHNRLLGQPEVVNRAPPLRNVPRQGHWDRREAPQAFVDHGVEVWEPIKGNSGILVQFIRKLALEAERPWLG